MSDETVKTVAVVEAAKEAAPPAGAAEIAVLRARLVQSELKAAAIRAGMVDLDGIKLIDMEGVTLTEGGEVADGPGVMAALRVAKPWLFGGSSSSAAAVPRAAVAQARPAMQMNEAEWREARAALLRQR